MQSLLTSLLAGYLLTSLALGQDSSADLDPSGSYKQLGRGLNIGNYLENPHPNDWQIKFENGDFSRIHNAGFNNVRIPMNWSAHVGAAPDFVVDPAYFKKVDETVHAALNAGLFVIIDDHNDSALMEDPDKYSDRFLAIWKQVSEHFKDEPASVLFELLNEPIKKMDAAHLNPLMAKSLAIVRATNPTRTVIIGDMWSYATSKKALDQMVLPEDDHHILITVHYYNPLEFTHQGAAFVPGAMAWLGTKWGSDADKQAVVKDLDETADWAREHHRPIYLGEFGTYLKGDMDSRAKWAEFVARTAEARGFSWSYYDFASGFGVCDPQTKDWIKPLRDALVPPSTP